MVYANTVDVDVPDETYHRITDGIGPEPVEGQLMHLCVRRPEGGLRYVQVWESEEACRHGFEERVLPVVRSVLGAPVTMADVAVTPLEVVHVDGARFSGYAAETVHVAVLAWNAGDQNAFVATYAEDCELVTPSWHGKGREAVREFWRTTMEAFPRCQLVGVGLTSLGETVVEEGAVQGCNTGPSRAPDGSEVPATGRDVALPYCGVHRVRGGRVVASHLYWDELGMIAQLGLVPG